MNIEDMLVRYDGALIDKEQLEGFDKSAMDFFHDRNHVDNPHIQMTLQFDITDAEKAYRRAFASQPGSSLTAYLTWRLLQTLKRYHSFHYRHLDNLWYKFGNLPLFFNVALKNSERLRDVVIENASKMDWPDFCAAYRQAIDDAINSKTPFIPSHLFNLATVICNLPALSFTHLSIHQLKEWRGRPVFYFGRRYLHDDRLLIPLFAQVDHSNADPILLDAMLRDFESALGCVQ